MPRLGRTEQGRGPALASPIGSVSPRSHRPRPAAHKVDRQASGGRQKTDPTLPTINGVWDRSSVTLSDPEIPGAAGRGKSGQEGDLGPVRSRGDWSWRSESMTRPGGRNSGREECQAVVLVRSAVAGIEGRVGENEESRAEVLPGNDAGSPGRAAKSWNR